VDEDIRTLERDDSNNWHARYMKYRVTGKFEWRIGDLIMVNELPNNQISKNGNSGSPWNNAKWLGKVVFVGPKGDGRVTPLDVCDCVDRHKCNAKGTWRVFPAPSFLRDGLYLLTDDFDLSEPYGF